MSVDVDVLRTAVPYIREYKDKVFVVKLGGELCHPGEYLDNICEQLSLLYQVGVKVVVVHGGGIQAENLSEKLGVECSKINGRRITSAEMLEVTKMSFAGTINTDICAAFRRQEVPAIGISGIDGNLLVVEKRPKTRVLDKESNQEHDIDFGYVGDIVATNTEVIDNILNSGYVPIIASLAADSNGQVFNVNADTIAATIAVHLSALKYCLLSRVDGVLREVNDPSTLISEMSIEEAQEAITAKGVTGGMIPKLQTCIRALQGGVPRAHIVNGLSSGALLREIFTNEGCGTLITS